MNNWKKTTLNEIATIIMGQSPVSESYNFFGDGLPFYQGVTDFGDKYVSVKSFTNSPTKIVEAGSVLFSVRAPVGRVNFTEKKCCIGRGNAGLIMKNGEQEFLYYLLKYLEKNILKNTTGTVFDSISGVELRKFSILVPRFKEEQKQIATVLSSLDDKIELLRAQNETLEKIAQGIFKEWFVNFTIEGKKLKLKNGVPEGWRVGRLTDIADFLNGFAMQKFPAKSKTDYLPVIKIKEMNSGITDQTDRASKDIPEKYIVNNGDILFSWSGSLDIDIWKYGRGALNQHLFKVTSEEYPKWFYFYWIKYYLPNFRQIATAKAVTMGHIQRHHLDDAQIIIPNEEGLKKADKLVTPIFEKIILNNSQIQTLSRLRDTLLPKLMSGEIKI